MSKVYLDVPFARKDEAKSMGARWDPQEKSWYAFDDNPQGKALLGVFPASIDERPAGIPLTIAPGWSLPGEDLQFGGKSLFVDMVPSTCWFTNVRSAVAPKHWKWLRLAVISRAGNACECCNTPAKSLECHERWAFDPASHTQTLKRLVALCKECHETTHFGLAQVRGRDEIALQHLMDVNHWTRDMAEQHVQKAFSLWEDRSESTWELDLSIIQNAGIEINEPQDGEYRRQSAARRLDQAKDRDDHESLSGVLHHMLRTIAR